MARFGQPLEFTENGIDFQGGAQNNVTYLSRIQETKNFASFAAEKCSTIKA